MPTPWIPLALLAMACSGTGDLTDSGDLMDSGGTTSCAPETWYADSDDDSFGDPAVSVEDCEQPAAHVADATDCDDTQAAVNPDASEVADDGLDQDCSGTDTVTCQEDADGDGHGTEATVLADDGSCDTEQGESETADDCDDAADTVFPGADEVADDGVDQDCSGHDTVSCFEDLDGDGYGTDTVVLADDGSCDIVQLESAASGDCDGSESSTWPGAPEACDDIDSDCDGIELPVVTVDGDDSFPTIQEALDAAGPGSVVLVCDGTYTENLVIAASLRLESLNGSATTIIDGSGAATSTVTIEQSAELAGLTITGGSGTDISGDGTELVGGGILAQADLSLEDSEITGNTASYGGGLFALNGTVTLSGVAVTDNTAVEAAGGLYMDGSLFAIDSEISGNSAPYGGGLAAFSGTIDLDGVVVSGNASESTGAGLYLSEATLNVLDSEISSNTSATHAAGFILAASTGSFSGTTVSDNLAEYGGGGYLAASELTLENSEFSANDGNTLGGGLYLTEGSSVEGGVFTGNLSTWGAGIYVKEEVGSVYTTTLTDLEFTDNLAARTYSAGGGIYAGDAEVLITGTTFTGNYGTDEGGAVAVDESTVILDGCVLTQNEAGAYAGAAMVFGGVLESIDSDWGGGPNDNTPDDVNVAYGPAYDDFGSGESFVCDASVGTCE